MSVLIEAVGRRVVPVPGRGGPPPSTQVGIGTRNLLLADLPSIVRYREQLERVILPARRPPIDQGRSTPWVYFPETGVLAESVPLRDGSSVAVNLVGQEGVADLAACLGAHTVPLELEAIVGGSFLRMPATAFVALAQDDGPMLERLHRYGQTLLNVRAYSAACSRLHPVQARLARLLLRVHEQVNGGQFFLTHDSIAELLGVSRPSVSVNATVFHRRDLIDYRRGRIRVLNRVGLEAMACECYWIIGAEFSHLSGRSPLEGARGR